MSVGEMTAMGEVHGENFVARFNGGEIDGHVRLRAAVRLHIDVLASEQPFRAIDRQLLGRIDVLAAAVPTLARVTFGVLVRHHATLCFHDGAAREILRRDQLDIFALAFFLRHDGVEDFRIRPAQRLAVNAR